MKFKSLALIAAAAGLAIAGTAAVAPVLAAGHALSADEAYAARVQSMKGMGGQMRTLATLEGEAMGTAADSYLQSFGELAALFPEDSIVEGSKALPAIWEDFEGFEAVIAKGIDVATVMKAAADAGDQAAFAAAAGQLGPVCGECHTKYRVSNN